MEGISSINCADKEALKDHEFQHISKSIHEDPLSPFNPRNQIGPLFSISEEYIKSLNYFSFELFSKLSRGKTCDTAFSPYSIYVILSLVSAIANEEARTEILDAFHLDSTFESTKIVSCLKSLISQIERSYGNYGAIQGANSIWIDKSMSDMLPPNSFDVLSLLEFSINQTSFPQPGVEVINHYVDKKTHGLIPKLLTPNICPEGTIYMLVNCLYFIDKWKYSFKEKDTSNQPFYGWEKDSRCRLMYQYERLKYFEDSNFQIVRIPYENTECAMIIALPKDIRNKNIFTNLNSDYILSAPFCFENVMLYIPKFTVRTRWENIQINLKECGIVKIFQEPCLPGDTPISTAIQEAVVIVDEEKTEAAAVTYMPCSPLAAFSPVLNEIEFRADHPFAFFIVHCPTNVIFFVGVILDPKE